MSDIKVDMPERSPSSTDRIDAMLVDRYLAGTAGADERHVVDRWIAADPAHSAIMVVMRSGHRTGVLTPIDVEAALARQKLAQLSAERASAIALVSPHTAADLPLSRLRTTNSRHRELLWRMSSNRWLTAIGMVATILVIALGGRSMLVSHVASRPLAAMTTYTTGRGERAHITLPDGSLVTLNVASRLDVPVDFTRGNRALQLTGEALFTIVHHDATPITVSAGHITAQVLGTTFSMRHYATDSSTTVAVSDGRVGIQSVVLSAGRMVEVGRTGMAQQRAANTGQFSFATGILTFHRMPLRDAVPELNRWYDVDIRLGDTALTNREINGNFVTGSLTDLMAILDGALDVRAVRTGRTLTLYAR